MDTNNPQGIGLNAAQEKIAALLDPELDNEMIDDQGDEPGAEGEELEAADNDLEGDEPDGEESGEDADADEGQGDEEPRFTVKVDGEDVEVTQSELLAGYQRDADYRRKTQALAKDRDALTAEKGDLSKERGQYSQLLSALKKRIEASAADEPDWDILFEQNPAEATRLKHRWDTKQKADKEQLEAINRETERVTKAEEADAARKRNELVAAERAKIPAAIPEWKDPKRMAQDVAAIKKWAIENGLSEAGLDEVTTVPALQLLRKAWLYDQGMARAKGNGGKPAPSPTLQPGKGARPSTDNTRRQQRLAKTGSVRDAAKIIESLL